MKYKVTTKLLLFATLLLLILSIVLGVASLFPIQSGDYQSNVLINSTFTLTHGETYDQGLSSFHTGENISVLVQSSADFEKNFSLSYSNGTYGIVHGSVIYSVYTQSNIIYTFNATANYYQAVFFSDSPNAGIINFQASVQEPKTLFPYSGINEASKIIFIVSLGLAMLVTLKMVLSNYSKFKLNTSRFTSLSKKNRRILVILVLVSLIFWLFVLAINSNPLGTLENWYTDNARHSYTSTLFLKDGFSVFDQPLGKLSNLDNSYYKFVTWPEMPHLYPLGSILLFLPFGILLQQGFNQSLIFKTEIAVFLIFATLCLYYFFKDFLKKDFDFRSSRKISNVYALLLKIAGIVIFYYFLVIFAADGMFDSIALLFALFALSMFLIERYDYFFLFITVSVFFKYQAGIFLLPIIVVGLIRLFQTSNLTSLIKNKAVISGVIFGSVSVFTAYLSAPYFMANNPQLVTSSLNAFSSNYTLSSNSQTSWTLQAFIILLTLAATLSYSVYMMHKNSLLSLSALFLLFPLFTLPYFQNWYLPFIFIYVLIPQEKRELEATILWLTLIVAVIFLSGVLL